MTEDENLSNSVIDLKRFASVLMDIFDPIVWGICWCAFRIFYVNESVSFECLTLIVAVVIVLEHVLLVKYTGFTYSKFVLGYRIVSENGDDISLKQSIIRFLTKAFGESNVLGIISAIAVIYRRDGRSLSDLISNTKAINSSKINYGYSITLGLLHLLSILFVVNIYIIELDKEFDKMVNSSLRSSPDKKLISNISEEQEYQTIINTVLINGDFQLKFEKYYKDYLSNSGSDRVSEWFSNVSLVEVHHHQYCTNGYDIKKIYNVFRPLYSLNQIRVKAYAQLSDMYVKSDLKKQYVNCSADKFNLTTVALKIDGTEKIFIEEYTAHDYYVRVYEGELQK